MSDCCGGNGGCSSSCKCGDDCNRCGMCSETLIVGVAPVKMHYEGSEIGSGAENDGCKCGPNCSCCGDSCKCGK